MAAPDIEAVWAALYERLKDRVPEIKTFSRRRFEPGLEQYPVLYLLDDDSESIEDGPEPRYTATGLIAIADRVPGKIGASDSSMTGNLNALIRSVRDALERQPDEIDETGAAYFGQGHAQHYTNLGGLVESLSLGNVEKGAMEKTEAPFAQMPVTFTLF